MEDLVLLATGVDRIGRVGVITGKYRFDPAEPTFVTDDRWAKADRSFPVMARW